MEAFLKDGNCVREGKWTQSIAIGSEGFVEKTRQELGIRARGRKVVERTVISASRATSFLFGPFWARKRRYWG